MKKEAKKEANVKLTAYEEIKKLINENFNVPFVGLLDLVDGGDDEEGDAIVYNTIITFNGRLYLSDYRDDFDECVLIEDNELAERALESLKLTIEWMKEKPTCYEDMKLDMMQELF